MKHFFILLSICCIVSCVSTKEVSHTATADSTHHVSMYRIDRIVTPAQTAKLTLEDNCQDGDIGSVELGYSQVRIVREHGKIQIVHTTDTVYSERAMKIDTVLATHTEYINRDVERIVPTTPTWAYYTLLGCVVSVLFLVFRIKSLWL